MARIYENVDFVSVELDKSKNYIKKETSELSIFLASVCFEFSSREVTD